MVHGQLIPAATGAKIWDNLSATRAVFKDLVKKQREHKIPLPNELLPPWKALAGEIEDSLEALVSTMATRHLTPSDLDRFSIGWVCHSRLEHFPLNP